MSTIVFTGVKGVGKSTLVMSVAPLLGLPCADYADLMLQATGLSEKAALDTLSREERAQAIHGVNELFEKRFGPHAPPSNCLLLTNHLTVVQDGLIAAPARTVHRSLHMLALAVVVAALRDIFERRYADPRRTRPVDSVSLIRLQQRANAVEAHAIALTYRIPLRYFNNAAGAPPTTTVLEWLTSLLCTPAWEARN